MKTLKRNLELLAVVVPIARLPGVIQIRRRVQQQQARTVADTLSGGLELI